MNVRIGDYVKSNSGKTWVVANVIPDGWYPVLGDGRHIFLIRDEMNADGDTDLVCTMQAEDDVYLGWRTGPAFEKGQRFIVEGERVEVHSATPLFVFFRMQDQLLTSLWRWQASLLVQRKKTMSFECADMLTLEGAI
ncbi:hypothetical protein FJV77_20705 [Mesorhizobium sp. WSM4306]|uniref:hypothetical protein n=1 Tax=Mesorhizobium sp. WSM4306 TaxID=2589885 RepID=UPI00115EDAC3|nr:hypothetical protein [Mesorhizobium sp. WSM4306]TRC93899.1 hypothetical protein FJV77_20705 [Mesorhizobium sp. WSM4306]